MTSRSRNLSVFFIIFKSPEKIVFLFPGYPPGLRRLPNIQTFPLLHRLASKKAVKRLLDSSENLMMKIP